LVYNVVRSVDMFLNLLVWLIIARSLISIVIRDYGNPLVRVLYEITEPILMPFRKIMEKLNVNTGMIDFSPFLAIIAINIARRLIWGMIF
jgi:YggT family protein